MSRLIPALLTVVAAVSPLWALPEPGVSLANAGFEEQIGTTGRPAAWDRYVTFPGQARLALDSQVKQAGQASLRLEIGQNTRCAVSQYVRVSADGAYTFSCMFRGAPGLAAPAQLQIEWFQLVDWPRQVKLVNLDPPSPWLSLTEQWTRLAATGSRPAGADLALVVIIVGNGQGPGGTAWADQTAFRPGAYPEPLVSNSGFELDSNHDGQPDDWGPAAYGEGFELKRDAAVAHSGAASACLTGAKVHGDRACYYQATPLFSPPRKIRLSLWYKGAGLSYLLMHLLTPAGVQKPGGGIEYGSLTATPPLKPEWQQFSQEIEVPKEARQAGIMRLDLILYQKGEGALWYDDVKVELIE